MPVNVKVLQLMYHLLLQVLMKELTMHQVHVALSLMDM